MAGPAYRVTTAVDMGAAMWWRTDWVVLRAEFLLRRANRRRRQRLCAELAAYTTEADRNDLFGLLDTYPDGQTAEIRDILARQQWRRIS
jgi:hypothetical protein